MQGLTKLSTVSSTTILKLKVALRWITNYNKTISERNWSSFILWNCDHPSIKRSYTLSDVNTKSGSWLHGFYWLENDEIGELPEEWNWLDSHSPSSISAKNVHFTLGGPLFATWEPTRKADAMYALEYGELYKEMVDSND